MLLNLDAVARAPVAAGPFPYLAATGVVSPNALTRIIETFPAIRKPGVFPLSALHYGDAFGSLIEDIRSEELATLLEDKFEMDLSSKPQMIMVRGEAQAKDGRIHTDSRDKILTCLLYLNAPHWDSSGGRLRLLRNQDDINSVIAEIPPEGGNFVAFKCTSNAWHGHTPFEGPRRYVMFNWLSSKAALTRNMTRHRLSAAFKNFSASYGY